MSDEDPLKAVRLAAGDLRATFVRAAACVGTALMHRGDELLAPRAGLDAYVRTGATMGLPLLHPWATASRDACRRAHARSRPTATP